MPETARARRAARGDRITTGIAISRNGSVTVSAQGIPAGDILVVGVESSGHGPLTGGTVTSAGVLTSPPAPSCISPPAAPPAGNGGPGS